MPLDPKPQPVLKTGPDQPAHPRGQQGGRSVGGGFDGAATPVNDLPPEVPLPPDDPPGEPDYPPDDPIDPPDDGDNGGDGGDTGDGIDDRPGHEED
jgi:hypothetical protein